MSTSSQNTNVTAASFASEVLERSYELPVLVDFWAPWCSPCKTLGPVLDDLAREFGGRFALAKVDTEAEPALGTEHKIRSIPAVKLFSEGRVVGEFVGALPGSQVRHFLETHLPSATDLECATAIALLDTDPATARASLRDVLETDPTHAAAHLGLARIALAQEEKGLAAHHLDAIVETAPEWPAALRLRSQLD